MVVERTITVTVGVLAYSALALPSDVGVQEAISDALAKQYPELSMRIKTESSDTQYEKEAK